MGCVVDDGGWPGVNVSAARYKMLLASDRVLESGDGISWTVSDLKWDAEGVDPGFCALRRTDAPEAMVVTARPQALRAEGRHAGAAHSASGWAGLAAVNATAVQPLDGDLYSARHQLYGLIGVDYAAVLAAGGAPQERGGDYVAFLWRYLVLMTANISSEQCCGLVTAGWAYSADAASWASPFAYREVPGGGGTAGVDLPGLDYAHIYGAWPSPSAGAAACAAACAANETTCVSWAYVSAGHSGLGAERCCLKRGLPLPSAREGVWSGARDDLAPLRALAEAWPLPAADDAAALNYGQVYPTTLLFDGARLLVFSSASQTHHGASGPNRSGILIHALRRDGFAALQADTDAAVATARTVSLLWQGGELAVNVDATAVAPGAAAAALSVAVVDPQTGEAVPGYAHADAAPLPPAADALAWVPTWAGGATLAALAGRTLAFDLAIAPGASVYALRGAAEDTRSI